MPMCCDARGRRREPILGRLTPDLDGSLGRSIEVQHLDGRPVLSSCHPAKSVRSVRRDCTTFDATASQLLTGKHRSEYGPRPIPQLTVAELSSSLVLESSVHLGVAFLFRGTQRNWKGQPVYSSYFGTRVQQEYGTS